jgi:signal transduction histidine kinase
MAKALKVFRDTAVEMQETNLREIRETRRHLIDAIESMSEGLSLYNADDRLLVCNTRYRQILYPGMHDLVTPGTTYEAILREAAEAGLISDAGGNVEDWVQNRLAKHREPGEPHVQRRNDGRWVRVNERRTEDGGTVAVYTDITDDREREQELREAKEQAEQALEELTQTQQSLIHAEKMASLGQLTAGVAHEIKNPLNFVKNFTETSEETVEEIKESLDSKLSNLDENSRKEIEEQFAVLQNFLSKISEHGKRADGIVKSMLAHASEGSGDMEHTDLNALVGETLTLTYHSVRAEHDDFNMELQKEFDPSVGELEIYPQEITRVLLNLIGNACYALQARKSVDEDSNYRPALKIVTKDLGDRVQVRIRDNGTGIPESVKDKIFNPFYTTKPTGEGTGLGLSLSYEAIVQQHHGQMEVDSKEGEFTEFIVTLPRTALKEEEIAGQPQSLS